MTAVPIFTMSLASNMYRMTAVPRAQWYSLGQHCRFGPLAKSSVAPNSELASRPFPSQPSVPKPIANFSTKGLAFLLLTRSTK